MDAGVGSGSEAYSIANFNVNVSHKQLISPARFSGRGSSLLAIPSRMLRPASFLSLDRFSHCDRIVDQKKPLAVYLHRNQQPQTLTLPP